MESIKVLAIGDPHFKVGNIPESDDMVDKLIKVAKNIQPKFIVVLGDILH
jgi:Icc-related predicted phosphoesterase